MIRVASLCVLWAAVAMVVALRGTARAVPTIYTISNYDFQASSTGIQPATLHDGQLSPDGSPIPYWYPITGAGSGVYHVWNPTAADFATAGDNGAPPGTTAGSQCLFNTATTANYQVALASGNAGGTGLQAVTTLSANTRYTMTVAIGSPLGATILDSQSIGFADTATQAFIMSHDDMYPNGWYNLGAGNPQSMTGFQGWGGFGDISLSINANDFIGTNRIKAGDGLLTVLNTAAGTCWTNVRLLSQNWYPRYASGNVTWDNSGTSAWSTASGGPFSSRWASGKDAVFEGNGGTVTVAETIASVNSLSFTTDCRAIPQTTPGYPWIPSYTLAGPGTISLTGDAVITVGAGTNNASNAGGGTALISCPLAGACGMYKAGAGNLVLTGASNYSGGTTVVGGTLMIGNGGTTGSIAGNVNNLANLAFNRSDTVAFGGAVSGTGSVDILGAGPGAKTVFTGTNTYVGITTIHAGSTLQLGGGGSTGSITGDVVNNGTLLFNRSSLTYSGIIYDGSTFFPSTPGGNGYSTIFGGEVAPRRRPDPNGPRLPDARQLSDALYRHHHGVGRGVADHQRVCGHARAHRDEDERERRVLGLGLQWQHGRRERPGDRGARHAPHRLQRRKQQLSVRARLPGSTAPPPAVRPAWAGWTMRPRTR